MKVTVRSLGLIGLLGGLGGTLLAVGTTQFSSAMVSAEERLIQLTRPERPILLGEVQGDPFELLSVNVESDVLVCVVRYAGGCAAHRFDSSWWSGFRESYPVQADVGLVRDAGGETCTDLITETLRFDLVPLKEAYRAGYQTTHGKIGIGVRSFQKPIPKSPYQKTSDLSVSHTIGDPSPEPLTKVLGVVYEF